MRQPQITSRSPPNYIMSAQINDFSRRQLCTSMDGCGSHSKYARSKPRQCSEAHVPRSWTDIGRASRRISCPSRTDSLWPVTISVTRLCLAFVVLCCLVPTQVHSGKLSLAPIYAKCIQFDSPFHVVFVMYSNVTPCFVPPSTAECQFPEHWWGNWFQKGVPELIQISKFNISEKGICKRSRDDKYIIENK